MMMGGFVLLFQGVGNPMTSPFPPKSCGHVDPVRQIAFRSGVGEVEKCSLHFTVYFTAFSARSKHTAPASQK